MPNAIIENGHGLDQQRIGKRGHKFTNWSTTYSCCPELYFEPQNEAEVREILQLAVAENKKIKLVGNGHSPSAIACTDDYMISLKKMNRVLNIDIKACSVKVQGGILISELNTYLDGYGLALSILGTVSDLSIAGAISTATHGTGVKYNVLSAYILETELMTASGDVIHTSRETDTDLHRAVCTSLGSLGIILSVTIQCEPAFNLHQTHYPAKLTDVLENLDAHVGASEHFRFIWFPHTDGTVIFHNRRTTKTVCNKSSWFWSYAFGYYLLEFLYWISTFLPFLVVWINRLYYRVMFSVTHDVVDKSFNVFCFDCLFKQYVTEWAIPRDKTAQVLLDLYTWVENSGFKAHFPVEVRFCKADDLLLSPAYGRDTCYINIIMYRPYNKFVEHKRYWDAYESIMMKAGGRPHWAKDHPVTSDQFQHMYPHWNKFCELRQKLDPTGLFINSYLKRLFPHHK